MFRRRSRNSYIRSPRSVTRQPIGMPSRSLKVAIDLRARVMTARWPAIFVSSSAAASTIFTFWIASPTPMFRTILSIFGTAIGLSIPNSFFRTGTTSLRYLSLSRDVISTLPSSWPRSEIVALLRRA